MIVAARKHLLKDMTFVEFRERMAEHPPILLPFGSQEEQGPHAPMGDFMLTERVAALVAERADAIAAPTVPFGYAEYFRAMPGGVAIRAATFCALLDDFADAFLAHGLTHLVILNGHTGNAGLIDQTVRKIKRDRGIVVPALHLWQVLPAETWAKLHGENLGRARGHGADPLTSVYRHLFPELLRDDLAAPAALRRPFGLAAAGTGAVTFAGSSVSVPLDVTDVTENGVMAGDPRVGSAEIGAEIVSWIVDYAARFIDHFRRCDPRDLSAAPTG